MRLTYLAGGRCTDCCNHTTPLGGLIWLPCYTWPRFVVVYAQTAPVVPPVAITASEINEDIELAPLSPHPLAPRWEHIDLRAAGGHFEGDPSSA